MSAVSPEVPYGMDKVPIMLFIVFLWGPRVRVLLEEQTTGNRTEGHPRCTGPPRDPHPCYVYSMTSTHTNNTLRYADMLLWLLFGEVTFTGNSVIVLYLVYFRVWHNVSGDFEVPRDYRPVYGSSTVLLMSNHVCSYCSC